MSVNSSAQSRLKKGSKQLDLRKDREKGKYRLGVVNFINTAPLLIPLREHGDMEGWKIIEGSPSQLNKMLQKGEIDVGLISSYAYAKDFRDYFVLRDFCISATGTVGSVVLYSRYPIYELSEKTICLTEQSATSINLLYIILEYFNGLRPGYVTGRFKDFLEDHDLAAYLAIGDEALRIKKSNGEFYSYDLASIWYEATSLPFVFALWAVRKDSRLCGTAQFSILKDRLKQAYSQGAKRLDEISARVSGRIPMSKVECLAYLKGIEFDLSGLKLRGLGHFFKLLVQIGRLSEMPDVVEV